MRVLVTSFAMDAHFNGCVPLAWALRAAGHDVRVASQPALTGSVTAAGLTAVPVGRDHRLDAIMSAVGDRILAQYVDQELTTGGSRPPDAEFLKGWNTVMTATFFSQIGADPVVDDLVEFARHWRPDLVLWEPFTFAGAVAARVTGAAHARVLSFPDLFLSLRRSLLGLLEPGPVHHVDDTLAEWLDWTAGRYGHSFDEELVTGQWSVDQVPRGVRIPLDGPTVPMRYVPYNGPLPAVVPPWLRRAPERPRVCVTLGLTARTSRFPNAVPVDRLFKAVEDLDVEVVATLDRAERELLPHVPDNVRLVEHVALDVLLPTCSAIVHHGGAGTWSTAVAHGVPQLSLGWIWDAIHRARRTEELGAGLYLPSGEVTADGLRERLLRILREPSFRAAAERLRSEGAADPSPHAVVPVLERLTAQHRATG
ncbi:activator-dependent family glycosyltransferase [Streptomyces sp. NPDC001678]|uniref:activator-dependent family glycosyltransferase n=1 Tax=Streptomyces sp. NPDC001678 TaxID=3364599 RepID=UPI0036776768